jgi:branched-chain amino acid transport system substrate-binding protein
MHVSQLDRRGVLRLIAALGAGGATAPVLAACSGQGAESTDNEPNVVHSGPPIKIGMVVPQTGALKPFGDEMANGFQLYLRQNGNKLGGRSVTLVSADEGDTAESSKAAAEKLLKQEKVVALTGVVNPGGMIAMKDLVESSQTPLVGSNASPSNLGGVYIWRTSFIPAEPSKALGGYLATNGGARTAIMTGDYNGDGAGQDEVKGFLETFNAANGTLAGTTHVTSLSTKSYADTFAQVKNSGATSLFAVYTGSNAVDFVKQLASFDFGVPLRVYAPGPLTEGPLLKQQGGAATNIFTAMNYSPDLDNPANRRFVADYQKAYQTIPSAYAVASYDAAMVIDKAIDGVDDDLTAQALNAALGRLGQIDSPRGAWQFTANRAPLQKWYLRQVRKDGMVLSNVLSAELTTLG